MPLTSERVKEVFLGAADKPNAQRAIYLNQACGEDAELRQRVERLLQAYSSSADSPVQTCESPIDATGPFTPNDNTNFTVDQAGPGVGTFVAGKYKLIEVIGEGGMGSVYMAQQTEPVKRAVALKLIKAGMDSKHVLARFEAERQALALMDHPNIAKVLDGGSTSQGQPFFVMELVQGVPVTRYCDEQHLNVTDRLKIFQQICHAVQHAHQKGIIHRDLKPSNILVESDNGRPVPKIIDFGLAKAMSDMPLTDKSLFTQLGQVLGTPLYMAPEQAGRADLDVDTRADIYALGVILYELLTGSTPLEKRRLAGAAWDEIVHVIREEEPPKPSSRLSRVEGQASIAALRQTEPRRLNNFVKGELDWIVMKALAKARDRRYATANGFAADVERFLKNEPVSAGPPTWNYRLSKFILRHRGPVIAGSLLLLALIGGIVGTTWGMYGEAYQRRIANANENKALKRLAQIEKEIEILSSVFKDLDPNAEERGGKKLRLALGERLDLAVKELEGEAVGDPIAVAKLQRTLASSLYGLGYTEKALTVLNRALETFRFLEGPEQPDTLTCMNNAAGYYASMGRYDVALPLFEETLKLRRATLGIEDETTLDSMANLSFGYHAAGKDDLALPLAQEALKLRQAKLGPEDPTTLQSMNNLALIYQALGKNDLAIRLLEDALKLSKDNLGTEHAHTLQLLTNLAQAYMAAGKKELALPMMTDGLRLSKESLGADHPKTITLMNNLALAYQGVGKIKAALPLFEETVKLIRVKLGPDHPNTLSAIANLAGAYEADGQPGKAEPLYRESLALHESKFGEGDVRITGAMASLGSNLIRQKKWPEAEQILRQSLTIREQSQPDAWTTFNTKSLLGGVLLGQKKYADAEPLLLSGYEGIKRREAKLRPQDKIRLTEATQRLVQLYETWDKKDKATEWRKKLPEQKK